VQTVCRWADAKHFPGINTPEIAARLVEQAEKYLGAYGHGAFILSSLTPGLQAQMPLGVVLLSKSDLAQTDATQSNATQTNAPKNKPNSNNKTKKKQRQRTPRKQIT